jgi:uncharacterized protein YdeI (YjbR/CyaY-like superfamily)
MARAAEAAERFEPSLLTEWRDWLARHHARQPPVWLVLRKGGGALPQEAAIEEALCWGWIDSLPRKLDGERWMLLFSPRKPGSPWSRVNKARVAAMLEAGRFQPAGLAKLEAARADGSWDSYEAAEDLIEPEALRLALDQTAGARAAWDEFAPSARKGILWWVASARTDATRDRRVAEVARLASLGLRALFPESKGR